MQSEGEMNNQSKFKYNSRVEKTRVKSFANRDHAEDVIGRTGQGYMCVDVSELGKRMFMKIR